jgi:hypothetical protein
MPTYVGSYLTLEAHGRGKKINISVLDVLGQRKEKLVYLCLILMKGKKQPF